MVTRDDVILLVEDDPDAEALTLRALRRARVASEVVVARDGVEALDYLFATGVHAGRDPDVVPRVVLLDLKLPRMDGLEVLRRIREHPRTRLLPVVILTSSSEESDRLAGYRLGANSYVWKPVDSGDFAEAVGRVGGYWLFLNQPVPRAAG